MIILIAYEIPHFAWTDTAEESRAGPGNSGFKASAVPAPCQPRASCASCGGIGGYLLETWPRSRAPANVGSVSDRCAEIAIIVKIGSLVALLG
jgi:hypothetical protein